LTEPLHLKLASLLVAMFGGVRSRIAFDLVQRAHYAYYGLPEAADQARKAGLSAFTAVEFGVAAGEGLINMCWVAELVTAETGVRDASQQYACSAADRARPDRHRYWCSSKTRPLRVQHQRQSSGNRGRHAGTNRHL
jgi:hypothetical protein